jgi:anti-sigma28 factor (negative regulator of flagellin synthesis)
LLLVMRTYNFETKITGKAADVAHIARPESVVMLTATVRAAREMQRAERIAGLKEQLLEGGYDVSSKDLAVRFLSPKV